MTVFEWLFSLIKSWFKKEEVKPQPEPPKPEPEPEPTPPEPEPEPEPVFYEGLEEINDLRKTQGLRELEPDDSLYEAAQKHAEWMDRNKNMSHTGENRSSAQKRAMDAGFKSGYVGENIAWGTTDIDSTMKMWYNSKGHRNNMLSKNYNKFGFGVSGKYWCQVFGRIN